MSPDLLVPAVLAALAALVAGTLGYLAGRRRPRADDLERIAELEAALEAARSRAETSQDGIDAHFEKSAELFGQLARDYRALFEHWAESANDLGTSGTRAAAIIDRARSGLLEDARTLEAERDEPTPSAAPAADAGTGEAAGADPGAEADSDGATPAEDEAPASSGGPVPEERDAPEAGDGRRA